MKKEIFTIPLIICEHDITITAVENNPAALSQLFAAHFWAAAHHLGTPGLEANDFNHLCVNQTKS